MKVIKAVLAVLLVVVLIVCVIFGAIPLGEYLSEEKQDIDDYNEILEEYTLASEPEEEITNEEGETQSKTQFSGGSTSSVRTKADFKKLLKTNKETVGWIQIPGTHLNYPVLHTMDSEKYLTINFKQRKSASGAIFSCGTVEYDPPSQNITLFGHNMRNRTTMFSSLVRYKDKSYYNKHSIIYFDTLYQTGTYKVFAAFNINVPNNDFNYTQSYFGSDESFRNFIDEIKKRSLYDMGVDVPDGAEILTLSTCDRREFGKKGRFLVIAGNTDQ